MTSLKLPTYEHYKDSGVEWLGPVPAHWEVSSLRSVASLKVQRNRTDLQVLSVYREYGVIPKDSRDDNHNATSLDTSTYKVVEPGDLAVNKMKAWQGSLGVSEYHGIVSPAYITCSLNKSVVVPRFLHYLLRSKPYVGAFDAISYGVRVGQWDLRYEDFKKVEVPIPQKPEQDRIVAFLDEKTAMIDELIAKKKRQIELLEEQKILLINRAVTRGLNPNAKLKPSGIEWIGEIPVGWEVKPGLAYFLETDVRSTSGEEELLSVSHITGVSPRSEKNITMFMSESYEGSKICEIGDIAVNTMWAWMAALGVSKYRGLISPSYNTYSQKKPEAYHPEYLDLLLRTNPYKGHYFVNSSGITTSRLRLYPHPFLRLRFLRPPLEEQTEIAKHCINVEALVKRSSDAVTKQIETLKTLRSTLIAQAVTGNIKI